MQLVLRNADSKIRTTFTGPDGEVATPTSPKVTIVRDSDGETIADAASATVESGGVASYTISAEDIPEVDRLTVAWSAADASAPNDVVEVVGGFLCSLEAIDPDADPSDSRRLREQAELWLEDACGVAFRPRYERETIDARGSTSLLLSRPLVSAVLSASDDGTAIDVDDLTVGEVVSQPSCFTGLVDIAYAHGYAAPPEPIKRAVIKLAQFASSGDSDRVTRFAEDDQQFWLTVGGVGGAATSIPEVNAAIEAYGFASVA